VAKPSFVSPIFLIRPQEKVIFKTNPHRLFVLVPEVALVAVGTVVVRYLHPLLSPQIPTPWFLIIFGGLWSFMMIVIFLHWVCIKYYLTNLRLVEERGIIGKRIMSIWLNRVQDVTCSFGILGRIFGFGDIEIESAGTYGKIVFSFLPAPRKLREQIESAVYNARHNRAEKQDLGVDFKVIPI